MTLDWTFEMKIKEATYTYLEMKTNHLSNIYIFIKSLNCLLGECIAFPS